MERQFVAAMHDAVMGQKQVSVKHLAAELNKAPSTLYEELNPMPGPDRTAKLGLEDAVRIMEIIEDFSPLQVISAHCGYSVREQSREPDGRSFDHECLQSYLAVSRFVEAAQKYQEPEKLVPLCNQAINELEDVVKRRRRERLGDNE